MGKLPDIVLRVVWDRCLHQDGFRGGHLSSSLCIWFGMWIPRMLMVSKVGLKVGLK